MTSSLPDPLWLPPPPPDAVLQPPAPMPWDEPWHIAPLPAEVPKPPAAPPEPPRRSRSAQSRPARATPARRPLEQASPAAPVRSRGFVALLVIVLALVIACCLGVLASNAGRILDSHGWAPAGAADAGQGWQEGAVPSGTPTASRVVPGY